MKSFLLTGQSNMAGRGEFGEVPEIINSKCFMLRNGKWVPMSEPINPDRSIFNYFHSGRGLSASFADEYAKYFNVSTDYLLGLQTEPTTNKDISFICEYTGLKEESVNINTFAEQVFETPE